MEINSITLDDYSFGVEDGYARNNINILNGNTVNSISGKIDLFQNSMYSNFNNGINGIYNTLDAAGATPASHNISDLTSSIHNVGEKGYSKGYQKGLSDYSCFYGMEISDNIVATATLINNTVTDMSNMFNNNQNYMIPTCGINVTNMSYAYYFCYNLISSPVCGDNVTNMCRTYSHCENLTGSPVCGDNVTDMLRTYSDCYNLTGSPVCGDNVTDMWRTYSDCYNLTGSPVCGDNVTNMAGAYSDCYNLTGSPVCGDNVTNISSAYYDCRNLTGSPVCGNNVTDMSWAYCSCYELKGSPVCGDNVINMAYTYAQCNNLYGDVWMNYNGSTLANSVNGTACFSQFSQNRINIHVPQGYAWDNWIYNVKEIVGSVFGSTTVEWTDMENGYYNTSYHIYVYNNVIL